jgi:predicted RNA-binding protein associated with RNAse of E/G family
MHPCIETKRTLSGETKTYHCELLHYETGFGVLRYVIDREYNVRGVKLVPGDETIALYWEGRPYTLYVWHRKGSPQPVYYFNIADRVSLSRQEFVWRDLAVDILVDDRGLHVLDEHELPADLEPQLARSIQEAASFVKSNHRAIILEADAAVEKYVAPAA